MLLSNVSWPIKLVVSIAFWHHLRRSGIGLLLVAVVAPLGELIAHAIDAPTFRHHRSHRPRLSRRLAAARAAGSRWPRGRRAARRVAVCRDDCRVDCRRRHPALALSRLILRTVIDQLHYIYFFIPDRIGVVDAARLLEGMGLAAAVVILFRKYPRLAITLPLALSAGAAIAAVSSVLLWQGIGFAAAVQRFKAIGYRVSGHIADVNAAGSYFAMLLCVALGMAIRERGRRRALWLALAALIGAGLWLAESRSALGAVGAIVAIAVLWALTARFSPRKRAATLAIATVLSAGRCRHPGAAARKRSRLPRRRIQTAVHPDQRSHDQSRPLFGVGEGQDDRLSPLFLSPQLAYVYGVENAHNYFLQVAAELGLAGFGWFVMWIGAAIVRGARALARAPLDARLLGVAGGVMVFLITCLTGHPFLVGEAVYPFWMVFGLMTALAASTMLNQSTLDDRLRARADTPPRLRVAAAAIAVVILAASPMAAARARAGMPESQAVHGLYPWETLEDGTPFRWTEQYASVFVPADVTRVEIPSASRPAGAASGPWASRSGRRGSNVARPRAGCELGDDQRAAAAGAAADPVQARRPQGPARLAAGVVDRRKRRHAPRRRPGREPRLFRH